MNEYINPVINYLKSKVMEELQKSFPNPNEVIQLGEYLKQLECLNEEVDRFIRSKENEKQERDKEKLTPLGEFMEILEENEFVITVDDLSDADVQIYSDSDMEVTINFNAKPVIRVAPGIPHTHSDFFSKIKTFVNRCDFDFGVTVNYGTFLCLEHKEKSINPSEYNKGFVPLSHC